MKAVICISVLVLCLLAESAVGTIHRVPSQYATIQSAINASFNGDTVLVSDGTYYENIRFSGKKIVVASTFLTTGDTSHISRTIIDGSQPTNTDSASVVYFISGEDTNSVLCGLTLRGGRGTRIVNAWGEVDGGGVFVWNSGARLVHNIITANSITSPGYGAGLSASGSGTQMLILEDNIVTANTITNSVWAGAAGIMLSLLDARLKNNIVSDNIAESQQSQYCACGGGLICQYGNFFVEGNLISRNKALSTGNTSIPAYGGGFVAGGCNLVFSNNRVTENLVQGSTTTGAWGGGFFLMATTQWPSADVELNANYIALNTVIGGSTSMLSGGGGIYVVDQKPRIVNNVIVRNSAPFGGGIALGRFYTEGDVGSAAALTGMRPWKPKLTHYERNPARPRVLLDAPVLVNNTIAFNRATIDGGGIATSGSWSPKVINSIAWGDTAAEEIFVQSGSIRVLYSNIQGGWPSDSGNINVDPKFVDTTYRLANTSPCLQQAIDSVEIDGIWYHAPSVCIYGMPRPSPAGTSPDIGACENPTLVEVDETSRRIPATFALYQNYPNPFNPTTTIEFALPKTSDVSLKIFDVMGREVATLVNEHLSLGTFKTEWDASGFASGIYFYRLQAGDYAATRKLVLMR